MKAIQDRYLSAQDTDDNVAFVIFNVKGCDLMAIHKENDFDFDKAEKQRVLADYQALGLTAKPFTNVRYFIPYSDEKSAKQSSYLPKEDIQLYAKKQLLKKFKYVYEDDKDSIEMMFSDIDDPAQTMESIISKIIDDADPDFGGLTTWNQFRDKVRETKQFIYPNGYREGLTINQHL